MLLDAPFTAVTQIIVYAGAIMVLFLFVVMLLNQHKEDDIKAMPTRLKGINLRAGLLLSVMLAIEVVWGLPKVGIARFSTDPARWPRSAASRESARRSSRRMRSLSK